MKAVFILLLIVFTSCTPKRVPPVAEKIVEVPVTVLVKDTARLKELTSEIALLKDSLKFYKDSITFENYINARRIEKIKYYIKITENKPSNQKFFYGWIRRTMSEK